MITKLNKISRVFEERLLANNIRGYAVTLEFTKLHEQELTVARFSNNDCRTDAISFQLTMHNEPICLSEDTVVYVNIRRSDMEQVFQGCQIIDRENGIVMLKLMTKSIMQKGECTLEVVIVPSERERLISPKIIYTVYDSLDANNEQNPTEDEIGIINGLVGEILNLNADITFNEQKRKVNEKERIAAEIQREEKFALFEQLADAKLKDIDMVLITNEEIDEMLADILG